MKSASTVSKPRRRYVQGVRAKAAEDTAKRIVTAFLDRLMTQWFDEITLDRVAADAGVTVQTVVRRFGGKEGLLGEAIKVMGSEIHGRRTTTPGDIDRMVQCLIADYEKVGDAVIRLLALEPRYPAVTPSLDYGRRWHRDWVEEVLREHLADVTGSARGRVLDALVAVTDVYTWKLLRRDMGRSASATTSTIARLIRATLAEFRNTGDRE